MPDVFAISEVSSAYRFCCGYELRRLRDLIDTHPIEIALFAAKHDYEELLKLTAEPAAKLPLSQVVPLLPERLVLPWVRCSMFRKGTPREMH